MTKLKFTRPIFNLFGHSTRKMILAKPFCVWDHKYKIENYMLTYCSLYLYLLFIFSWSQQTMSLHLMNISRLSILFVLMLCNSSHTPAIFLVNSFMCMLIFFSFNINLYIRKTNSHDITKPEFHNKVSRSSRNFTYAWIFSAGEFQMRHKNWGMYNLV